MKTNFLHFCPFEKSGDIVIVTVIVIIGWACKQGKMEVRVIFGGGLISSIQVNVLKYADETSSQQVGFFFQGKSKETKHRGRCMKLHHDDE